MKFDLKNIGPIKEASIKVDGLTVIAGENSIGKSAIGKAIFCLMKGTSEVFIDINLDRRVLYQQTISEIEKSLPKGEIYENIISELQISKLYYSKKNIEETYIFNHHIDLAKEYVIQLLDNIDKPERILELINHLETINMVGDNDLEKKLSTTFDVLIRDVFNGSINNKKDYQNFGSIKLSKDKTISYYRINNDKTIQSIAHRSNYLKDVILIESPLILSLYRFIRDSLAFNRNGDFNSSYQGLPYHTFDFVKKISEKHYAYNHTINKEISEIISGNLDFDNNQDDFIFVDSNNEKHDIVNVASGIKSFGILQLLATSENLNEDNILIIDEPEVHLHPFWQVEYAKILVKLAENNIPVVVASHSPYFIEALKTYSDKTIKDKTNFYLGEMQEGGSVFKDVTDDLEPIFELLAIPMQQLMLDNH
ncbi:MAG: energy-coupling factor transporter ATP-binding protein EcfA2 [Saprospiraceae bacterium]|jgi:hypothetical protein